jgi:hypothetical protein
MFDKQSQLWRRLLFHFRRNRFDRELEEEMRSHYKQMRKALGTPRRDLILHRQHHILNIAQVQFLSADGGPGRKSQDFLGD